MKLDYIIALAGAIVHEHSQRGGVDTPHVTLARAVLALLTPDKPCGFAAEDAGVIAEMLAAKADDAELSDDELHYIAIEMLKLRERRAAEEEQSNG